MAYTYGKTLLTPGQRIGYLAVAPTTTERERVSFGVLLDDAMIDRALPGFGRALPRAAAFV